MRDLGAGHRCELVEKDIALKGYMISSGLFTKTERGRDDETGGYESQFAHSPTIRH
jgi:hypothetical protein